MILSDGEIRAAVRAKELIISPWVEDCLQPASVDVHLGSGFMAYPARIVAIDPANPPEMHSWEQTTYLLNPGEFLLGRTTEYVEVPNYMAMRVEGKSSLGRLGLIVHATAGYVDPGFKGTITLEMYNCAPKPILLRHGMKIAQFAFSLLSKPAQRPYGHPDLGSHYQGQVEVAPSAGL